MKVFTTGQVSKVCEVAPRTVSKWFDSGRLKGYRIPGSQDRRIPRVCLVKFLKENGMPLGILADQISIKVLIVSQNQSLTSNLRQFMTHRLFEIADAQNGFEAGSHVRSFHPDCVIMDFSLGDQALKLCEYVRRANNEIYVIGILPDCGDQMSFNRSSISETFKQPFDPALLAARVMTLVGTRKELV